VALRLAMTFSALNKGDLIMAEVILSQSPLQEASTPQEVWNAVKEILASLTRLHIKTSVTDYTGADGAGGKDVEICTSIDLLQADREHIMHESFLRDPALAPLRDFHTEQVKLAEQEVQKRFDFVQNLGMAIINALNNAQ
jgi:hypothetical protein